MPIAVLFAGLGASEIRLRALGGLIRKEIWLATGALAAGGWNAMALDATGTGPVIPLAPSLEGGPALSLVYDPLRIRLIGAGYQVVAVNIDWRRRLADNLPSALAQVRALGDGQVVDFVAHSRGGFLAAAVWNALLAGTGGPVVRRAVSLGTPWGGSYEPIPYLGGWASTLQTIDRVLFVAQYALTPLQYLIDLRAVCASWPSLYEMLPNPSLASSEGDAAIGTLYDPLTWSEAGVPISSQHLAAARARWGANNYPPLTPNWLSVVGSGILTRGPVVPGLAWTNPDSVRAGVDGDGVVPLWSAEASPTAIQRVHVGHSLLPVDPLSASAAIDFLLR